MADLKCLEQLLSNRSGNQPCAMWLNQSGKTEVAVSFLSALAAVEATSGGPPRKEARIPLSRSIPDLLGQAKALEESPASPILAVAGLLNAGKTSLVAGFLSPQGRKRLLIGEANIAGTHRFVVWLPQAWRESPGLWSTLCRRLSDIFGRQAEELSNDPAEAHRQYNGATSGNSRESAGGEVLPEKGNVTLEHFQESMAIPLIATDPALDAWGIGLMDCPDIQTGILSQQGDQGHAGAASYPINASERIEAIRDERAMLLKRALKIASAFVVVTAASALQDETVHSILDSATQAMPHLKKILAVNRVPRRYQIAEIAGEVDREYRERDLWRVYMAYHFLGPADRERLPSLPERLGDLGSETQRQLPIFIRIDHPSAGQPPNSIADADYLLRLGDQLDRGELTREVLRSTKSSLRRECLEGWKLIRHYSEESLVRLRGLHQTFLQACLTLSSSDFSSTTKPNSMAIRLQVSREIVGQIAESLERTAPWWAVPGRRLMRWSEQIRTQAKQVQQWVAFPSWLSEHGKSASQWVRSRLRAGDGARVISGNQFAEAILRADTDGHFLRQGLVASSPLLIEHARRTIDRFQQESRTRLNEKELDAYTRQVWEQMPWRQRLWTGIAPAGILFAPLLAVLMLPMDFGGSTVLVFASIKELLVAGAAGVGMAMLNPDRMPLIAENEAAWQQVGDLFAITCDEFGIPRPTAESKSSFTPRLNAELALPRVSLSSGLPIQMSASDLFPTLELHATFESSLEGCFHQAEMNES